MSTTESETPVRASAFGCITIPFLLIACIPLVWGARANWLNGQLARTGEVVPGRVVELRYVDGNVTVKSKHESGLSPVVTYTTRTGEARTAVGSVNRGRDSWKVGDTVDVIYDPANPVRADLSSEVANWPLWFGIWCLVAALPLAIAMAPVVLLMRQRRAQRQP